MKPHRCIPIAQELRDLVWPRPAHRDQTTPLQLQQQLAQLFSNWPQPVHTLLSVHLTSCTEQLMRAMVNAAGDRRAQQLLAGAKSMQLGGGVSVVAVFHQ